MPYVTVYNLVGDLKKKTQLATMQYGRYYM